MGSGCTRFSWGWWGCVRGVSRGSSGSPRQVGLLMRAQEWVVLGFSALPVRGADRRRLLLWGRWLRGERLALRGERWVLV